ncbi:MAG: YaiI/YqxD family protein [Thermoleophilia bacterium]|nr:YaiI/YqxD family protein [Thermoleophilia bacterium]
MTTLFVDADACPVTRDAIAAARSHSLPVVLVANQSQNLTRYAGRTGVEILQVASGRDSADFAMVPRLSPGDIVITADIGLAAMALGRGCRALSPRGHQYLQATIDAELAVRHAEQRHRRAGGRTTGPTPFRDEDREQFREVLARLLAEGAAAGR